VRLDHRVTAFRALHGYDKVFISAAVVLLRGIATTAALTNTLNFSGSSTIHSYEIRPRKGLIPNDFSPVHALTRKDIDCAPLKPQR
jgi:hypothetical protein